MRYPIEKSNGGQPKLIKNLYDFRVKEIMWVFVESNCGQVLV